MASSGQTPYRVDPTGPFTEQLRALIAKASSSRERQDIREAVTAIVHQLQTRPLDWGDPERRTRKKGGKVYHGIVEPLIVQYAAFKRRKVVWLLTVRALPGSSLAE